MSEKFTTESGTGRNAGPAEADTMQEFLSRMIGKRIDVRCGASSTLRGEVVKVEKGVLQLKDSEQKMCFIAVDKIVVVWEAPDEAQRAGFVSG